MRVGTLCVLVLAAALACALVSGSSVRRTTVAHHHDDDSLLQTHTTLDSDSELDIGADLEAETEVERDSEAGVWIGRNATVALEASSLSRAEARANLPVAPSEAAAAATKSNDASASDSTNPGFISELRFDPSVRERRKQLRRVVSKSPTKHEQTVATYTETFTFHASQTSPGYTLGTYTDKTIEQLAEMCFKDVRCTGFSSLGELKSFIRPAAKWVVLDVAGSASINTAKETAGIYFQPQWYRFQPVPCPCGSDVPLNLICSDPNSGDQYLGDPLTDSSCYREKPAVTTYTCSAATCVTLAWEKKEFDACPSCGVNITVARPVKCVSKQGTIFPNKFCKYVEPMPLATKICNADVACQWLKVDGECKVPCGPGYKEIHVTCSSPADQSVVPDIFCPTVKPKTVRKCQTKACVWNTMPDGQCSHACGPGHRQLKATCIEAAKPDVALPEKQCAGVRRPSSLIKCNNRPCSWDTKATSPCSQPCGKGQQTVANTCKDPLSGDVMPAKQCGSEPPPSFQYCSVRTCQWDTTPRGGCSTSCGVGVQYFNVTCRDPPTGHRVADAQCKTLPPPAPEAPCENKACGWRVRPIGKCSAACGHGEQKFKVTCEDPITGKLIDEQQCGPNKPAAVSECHVRECHWHRSSKGKCSSPCGPGIQAYDLTCRNPENGKKQKKVQCKNIPVPALSEPCFLHACEWHVKNEGKCSQICGPGRQDRTVSCHDPVSSERVPNEHCTGKAPSKNTKCYGQACVWSTVPTSTCSTSCGAGTQSVNITCTDPKRRFVLPDNQCFDASRPNATQVCNTQACRWKATPSSACSNTCGKGTQKMNVVCTDPKTNKAQTDAQCADDDAKPEDTHECNVKPCAWVAEPPVAKCSQLCGPGHVEVNVTCQDTQAGRVYPDAQCAPDVKPPGLLPCQLTECKWLEKWSDCPSKCGGDFQYATATCIYPKDSTVVSNTQCKASPPLWKQCNTQACSQVDEAFLYYNFEEDVNGNGARLANRVSGAANFGLNGLIQGSNAKSTGGRGDNGHGLALPASGDHTSGPFVIIPAGKALTSPSFSLSFWMMLTATPTAGRFYIIVDNRGTNGGGEGFVVYLDPRDGLLYLNDAYSAKLGKSHFADSGTVFPNDGRYHHVAVTYNQKLVRFYFDGKQTSVVDPSHAFKFTVSISQHEVYLRGSPDQYWRYLSMNLDEFAYFAYPLKAEQVLLLANTTLKNTCEAGRMLTGGGCTLYANVGDALNAKCQAGAPYSLKQCLQPLWGLNGCSSLATSYPTAEADSLLWGTQTWPELKATVSQLKVRDVEPQLKAKKSWGVCANRTPSGLDALCDHPPPYHTTVCLQALFLESGCIRSATGFPASASHPLTVQLNELSWRDAKAKMLSIIKNDVRGGNSEGVCHGPVPETDTQ